MLELKIAALAFMSDIARKERINIETERNLIRLDLVTFTKYRIIGILIAIEAAVMFLLPLTPFTLVKLKYLSDE